MSYDNDDDLLAALGRAVGPDLEATPTAPEREALRSLVLRAAADPVDDASVAAPLADVVPITHARRLRSRLLVGSAAVVVALSGATAVAAAVNDGALPAPVRVVVRAVGLPIDSVELARARAALKHLRTATDAELADGLARAERALAGLTPSERSSLGDDVERTLADARERLGRVEAAAAAATSTTTPSTEPATVGTTRPSSPPPSSTTGAPTGTSVDDRGGRGSDDSSPDDTSGDDRGGGHGADDSSGAGTGTGDTTATSDSSGPGGGGGSDDSSATSAPESDDTTATSDDSGRNRGGDTTTATSDPSGKDGDGDSGRGGGSG